MFLASVGMADLDTKTDKDIVKFVEEREIARNALQMTSNINANSAYSKARKNGGSPASADDTMLSKKLSMKGKCSSCQIEINLYKKYRSGKMNKDPFRQCLACYKKKPSKQAVSDSAAESETLAVMSFVGSLDLQENANANVEEEATASSRASIGSEHVLEEESGDKFVNTILNDCNSQLMIPIDTSKVCALETKNQTGNKTCANRSHIVLDHHIFCLLYTSPSPRDS